MVVEYRTSAVTVTQIWDYNITLIGCHQFIAWQFSLDWAKASFQICKFLLIMSFNISAADLFLSTMKQIHVCSHRINIRDSN